MVTLSRPSLAMQLLDIVERRAASCAAWVREIAYSIDVGALETVFAEASRRVGAARLALDADEVAALAQLGLDWSVDTWCVDDAVRVAALLVVAQRAPAEVEAFIARRRRCGDTRQRAAIVRALPLLPDAQQWVALALQARRGDVRAVLEALACDNPYPSVHFHAVHFEELVMAALEAELPLARMVGLAARVTERLSSAAAHVAAARRAAGRRSPPDLWGLSRQDARTASAAWSPA